MENYTEASFGFVDDHIEINLKPKLILDFNRTFRLQFYLTYCAVG
jgi:hypothetical protein